MSEPHFEDKIASHCGAGQSRATIAATMVDVAGYPTGARRHGRQSAASRGQALVEFSLVAPLFFFLVFMAVSAGFYTLERATAVNATTAGARIAAGAQSTDLNRPALAQARVETVRLLRGGLPGTRVVTQPPGSPRCPVLDRVPAATVVVCAFAPASDTVRVEVIGHPASFISPQAGGLTLPLDIYAQVRTVVFQR